MAEADEAGKLTKAYGFNPIAAQQGLWSTDPIWQANVESNSLTAAQTQYHYLHTDHLGTPQLATTKEGQTSWKAQSEVFGAAGIIQSQSTIEMNLRLPGQYFDSESGTHYNWHRDYQPGTGRYLQADPIGLAGGINTYAYVAANPAMYIDPDGLTPVGVAIGIGVRVIGGRAVAGAIGAAARSLLGPIVGGIAACVLAGVCTFQDKTPNEGEAGSCHVNPGSGQERKYGDDGKPEYDIDWDHDHGQGVPHGHNWDRGPNGEPIRGPGVPISPWPRGRGRGE